MAQLGQVISLTGQADKTIKRGIDTKVHCVLSPNLNEGQTYVRVFNTLGTERRAVASVALPRIGAMRRQEY